MKSAVFVYSVAILLKFAPLVVAADSPDIFSFANPTVRIPVAAQDGSDEIVVRASKQQDHAPEIKDHQLPSPGAATVTFELIKDGIASPNTWRYKVAVRGLSPANTVQQHYALIEKQVLPYVVTNQPLGSFAWTVAKPPDPWVGTAATPFDTSGPCVTFGITAKDSPATGVAIVTSTLIEQTTKVAIPVEDLRLCRADDNSCAQQNTQQPPIDLQANTPTPLKLCSIKPLHGNYHGAVVLASLQKPDGDTILQSASFSTTFMKGIGFLIIALGVGLAWLVKVYLRGLLNRDQALQPVTLMRVQLRRMEQALVGLRPLYKPTPVNLNAAIATLLNDLSDHALDQANLLPPKFPNPIGTTFDPTALKAYLEKRNPQIQLLAVLIDEGVVRAQAEDNGSIAPAPVAAVNDAITQIDNIWLAAPQPSPDSALQQVRAIVARLHNAIHGIVGPAGVGLAGPVPAVRGDFDVLQMQVAKISTIMWVVYGLVTALSGFAVLVLNNPGFGITLDLIFAFFWGLGLPTAIQSLTPTSAATALNISIAKT